MGREYGHICQRTVGKEASCCPFPATVLAQEIPAAQAAYLWAFPQVCLLATLSLGLTKIVSTNTAVISLWPVKQGINEDLERHFWNTANPYVARLIKNIL